MQTDPVTISIRQIIPIIETEIFTDNQTPLLEKLNYTFTCFVNSLILNLFGYSVGVIGLQGLLQRGRPLRTVNLSRKHEAFFSIQ